MQYEDSNCDPDGQDKSRENHDDQAPGGPYLASYRDLQKLGYERPLPLVDKRCFVEGWSLRLEGTPEALEARIQVYVRKHPDADIGLRCGGRDRLIAADIDTLDPAMQAEIEALLPPSPAMRVGNKAKAPMRLYRLADGAVPPLVTYKDKEQKTFFEWKWNAQVAVPKTRHPNGYEYEWGNGAELPPPLSELPEIGQQVLDALYAALEPYLYRPKAWDDHKPRLRGEPTPRQKGRFPAYAKGGLRSEANTLSKMPKDSGRNIALNNAAFKMKKYFDRGYITEEEVIEELLWACQKNGLLHEERDAQCLATIKSGLHARGWHELPDIFGEDANRHGPSGAFTKAEAKLWAALQHRADRGVSFDQVLADGELIYKATLPANTDSASETKPEFEPISSTGAFNIWLDYAQAIDPVKAGAELRRLWDEPIAEGAAKATKSIGSIYWEKKEKHGWKFPQTNEDYQLYARSSDADEVDKLNTEYARIKDPVMIIRLEDGHMLSKDKFLLDVSERGYFYNDKNGDLRRKALGEVWLQSSHIRIHKKVVFNPGQPKITNKNEYNLFNGFPVKPVKGNAKPFIRLTLHLCNRRKTEARYLLQWLAHSFQRPEIKIFSAPFLFIKNTGIGKSRLFELVGQLHGGAEGGYYREVEVKTATDNKNTFLRGALLCYVDEAIFKDKRNTGSIFKKLITKKTAIVDEKYVPTFPIDVYANFAFTSNYADGVLVEDEDRRYFVLQVPTQRLPQKFYDQLDEDNPKSWWNTGGKEAVMYLLMNTSLEGFNPRAEAPLTPEKEAIIEACQGGNERKVKVTLERCANTAYPLRHFDDLFDLNPYLVIRGGTTELNWKEYHSNKNYFSLDLIARGARKWRTTFKDGSKKMLWAVTDPEAWGRRPNKAWAAMWLWQEAHMHALTDVDQLAEGIETVSQLLVKDTIKAEDITCIALADSNDKARIKNKLEAAQRGITSYEAVQAEVKAWLNNLKDQATQRAMEAEKRLSELTEARYGSPLAMDTPSTDDFRAEIREIRQRRSLAAKYVPTVGELG